jgi:4,5-DOPA dioxygenase extradiol
MSTASSKLPALFVAHGAPPLLDDPRWMEELAQWGLALTKPRAILMLSAHWERRPLTLAATRPVPLVYDFYGFPERFYRLRYASPGAPALAERLVGLLGEANVARDEARGLDHGAYIPLMPMFPKADVPVLQASLPTLDARALFDLGRKLAPLREEGVLVVGSGFLTHNLRALAQGGRGTPAWAAEFDTWVADVVSRRDWDALCDYQARAPGWRESHPTVEHFVPLIVAAGAASDAAVRFPIEGWFCGAFTKRSVQLG